MRLLPKIIAIGLCLLMLGAGFWRGMPLKAQSPAPEIVESDDGRVMREGVWSSQAASEASGGRYLYNDPSSVGAGLRPAQNNEPPTQQGASEPRPYDSALVLQFAGPSLEIIYVSGPTLGTLAIEVDGTVLRTVITTAESVAYGQSAKIDYLTDEAHELQVYAQGGGVVAVDAFVANPVDPSPSNAEGEVGDPLSTCGTPARMHRASENNSGIPGLGTVLTGRRTMSDDGRFVAFMSYATNLVPNDTNNRSDVFVHDRQTCQTTRVSVSSTGVQGNDTSWQPSISGDGRYVLFESGATNLDPTGTGDATNMFLHDRQIGMTTQVSRSIENPNIGFGVWAAFSGNGRYVVFSTDSPMVSTDTNDDVDVYLRDMQANTLEIISLTSAGEIGDGASAYPYITHDGRYITYLSYAALVPEDTTGGFDAYLYDTVDDTLTLVSYSGDGSFHGVDHRIYHQSASFSQISAPVTPDGRYVVFTSMAPNMTADDVEESDNPYGTDVFVRDVVAGTTTRVTVNPAGNHFLPSISDDGRYVAFSSTANDEGQEYEGSDIDVFVYDRVAGTTALISKTFDGGIPYSESAAPYITPDGRYIAFYSYADNLIENGSEGIYLVDTLAIDTPASLTASAVGRTQINLTWVDTSSDETEFRIERSPDGLSNWTEIASVGAGVTNYQNTGLTCNTTYHYRVRAYRGGDMTFSAYSGIASATTFTCVSTLVMFNAVQGVSFINTLQDIPPVSAYNSYTLYPPVEAVGANWVMGDWDGDGVETPGAYYGNGVFRYTNSAGQQGSNWTALWLGLAGRPAVAGRFDGAVNHDCIGAVDSANFPPYGTAFALYFTCDLSGGAPAISLQWLSVVLPDNQGHSGTHQFAVGDFDNNGVESIAIRRGAFIAYTNVPPSQLASGQNYSAAEFNQAQYWGTPPTITSEGLFVAGNWDATGPDSFGVMYTSGQLNSFYYRNDLDWNSGIYNLQRLGYPVGFFGLHITSWR